MSRMVFLMIGLLMVCGLARAQRTVVGTVVDLDTREPISFAHIYSKSEQWSGTASNDEGAFILNLPSGIDSIYVSCMGYASSSLVVGGDSSNVQIELRPDTHLLQEVLVKPKDPWEIVENRRSQLTVQFDSRPYNCRGFFLPAIKDREDYFSIAEAALNINFPLAKKPTFELQLVKGRTSERVHQSRLFEDYHPGGGPHLAAFFDADISLPQLILHADKSQHEVELEEITWSNGHLVYVISYDQLGGLKESLRDGRVYIIDADGYELLGYTQELSPKGMPYHKHLRGSDKTMAALLTIEYTVRAQEQSVMYQQVGEHWYVLQGRFIQDYAYKQPGKDVDLGLSLNIDYATTAVNPDMATPIAKEDQWERKMLVSNMPAVYDASVWGNYNALVPDRELLGVVEQMNSSKIPVADANLTALGWDVIREQASSIYRIGDTLIVRPLKNTAWGDEEQATFIYQMMEGRFTISTSVCVRQANNTKLPDFGFQQAGIMVRDLAAIKAKHVELKLGTRGSSKLKLTISDTNNSESRHKPPNAEFNCVEMQVERGDKELQLA